MGYSYSMKITFWGTRGSCPVPGGYTRKYGGNTPCIELRTSNNDLIIFDSGTGIKFLGDKLIEKKDFKEGKGEGVILITHHHWDHIQGLLYFKPVYVSGNKFMMYGKPNLEKALRGQMENEKIGYFPIDFDKVKSPITFKKIGEKQDIELGQKFDLSDEFTAIAYLLNHPQDCLGYRIESSDGKVFSYVTDVELGRNKKSDENALILAKDTDLLIVDAQYTPEEYKEKQGWGHNSWLEAIKLGKEAEAKKIVLFHHDPDRTDKELKGIEEKVQKEFGDNIVAAREGHTIYL